MLLHVAPKDLVAEDISPLVTCHRLPDPHPMRSARNVPVPIHHLRPNETVWTPPTVAFIDTEARWTQAGDLETQTMRLWCGLLVDRRQIKHKDPGRHWGHGDTPAELADWVESCFVGRDTVWCYCHNLNYDVSISALPLRLAERGWEIRDFSVRAGAPWFRIGRRHKSLTLADSWSWLPQSLASIGALMGRHKVDLPDDLADAADWHRRCAVDVDLTARAMLDLMAWWDRHRLGRWTISGPASGWNAYRHRKHTWPVTIDVTPELVAQDRLAVRGGRKDSAVYRRPQGGPWVELDLKRAYPTTVRELPTPFRRAWQFKSLDLDSPWIGSPHFGPVAECVISTSSPRYPVRWRSVNWYPVGTFSTVLAGPELAEARDRGELVEIRGGQMHQLGYPMRDWANWVLDPTAGGTVDTPTVAVAACNHWGRSVIGKWGAHGHTAELRGVATRPGWHVGEAYDARTNSRAAEVDMAGRQWWIQYDGDSENCYPAVLAWVESYVRVRLSRVLDSLAGAWVTADTDGLIVDLYRPDTWWRHLAGPGRAKIRDAMGAAERLCAELAPLVAPLTLRPKKLIRSLDVLGPQHYQADDDRRYSGLPSTADELGPGEYRVTDWPGLQYQMNHAAPGSYVRPTRTVRYLGPTCHRWVLADGTTRPVVMTMRPDGGNDVLPWGESYGTELGNVLAGVQYRKLQALSL